MFWHKNRFYVAIFLLLSIGALCSHAGECKKDFLGFRLYMPSHEGFWELKTSGFPSISTTPFDPKRPTRIFIHGYNSWEYLIDDFREAYAALGDFNFIAVDWLRGACSSYYTAKGNSRKVGSGLANLLDTLESDHGLDLRDVTIIGHSLGAHIAGFTGKYLRSKNKIGCIIGLDPASVGFFRLDPEYRLDKDDAEYVQVIHTDGNIFGLMQALGHADFYPNGGKDQIGCNVRNRITIFMDLCSHERAHQLFLTSLTTNFTAVRCVHGIRKGACEVDKEYGLMGGDISRDSPKPKGIFYLETKGYRPYVIPNPREFNFRRVSNGTELSDSDSDSSSSDSD